MKLETLEWKHDQIQKELKDWNIKKQEFKMREIEKEEKTNKIIAGLTEKALFYLKRVPDLVNNGYDEKLIHKSFCNNYLDYKISYEDFKKLVEHALKVGY